MKRRILGKTRLRTDHVDIRQLHSDETSKAAQIFIGMVPILLVCPFLQRYFTKGLVLGAVQG